MLSYFKFHQLPLRLIFIKITVLKCFLLLYRLKWQTSILKSALICKKCFDIVHLFCLGSNKGLWYHFEEGCLTEPVCLFGVMWAAFRKCHILFHDCIHSLPLLPGKTCKQRRHGFRPFFHDQWKCFVCEERKKHSGTQTLSGIFK